MRGMENRKPEQHEAPPQPPLVLTLTPHRSLSREGFVAIMGILVAVNLAGGILFLATGAWPVTGFMGLDVLLVWWAFRKSFADGNRGERITISGDAVRLQRFVRDMTTEDMTFNRRWLHVSIDVDDERELVGKLILASHGKATEIASFLGAEERLSLAQALRRALSYQRI